MNAANLKGIMPSFTNLCWLGAAIVAALSACSTSDATSNGAAGASGANGTSGASGTAGAAGTANANTVCAKLTQFAVDLGCVTAADAQATTSDCIAHAATASVPCEEQLSAYFTCMLAQPESAFECNTTGMGALQSTDNACAVEGSALADCNAGVDGG
jgi:hypothetical protein